MKKSIVFIAIGTIIYLRIKKTSNISVNEWSLTQNYVKNHKNSEGKAPLLYSIIDRLENLVTGIIHNL